MFYEKWFDPGDLVLYSPHNGFMAYDEDFDSYQIENLKISQVGVFLNYIEKDDYSLCKVFVSSLAKPITVPQVELKLLSKKR